MIKRYCDCCGKELHRYIKIIPEIEAVQDWINVGDLIIKFSKKSYEWCPECAERILLNKKEEL